MSKIDVDAFPLEGSMCNKCKNRFSRLIVPLNYDWYDVDPDDFDLEEGEELIIEQHVCLISHQDLDGTVKECNHFKNLEDGFKGSFFTKTPF